MKRKNPAPGHGAWAGRLGWERALGDDVQVQYPAVGCGRGGGSGGRGIRFLVPRGPGRWQVKSGSHVRFSTSVGG